jgi:hypothetical protein
MLNKPLLNLTAIHDGRKEGERKGGKEQEEGEGRRLALRKIGRKKLTGDHSLIVKTNKTLY